MGISCPSFSQTDEFAADEPSSTGYAKKSESVTVVVTLIHKLTVEFEKEISVAKLSEGKAQSAYEETVKINQERSHEYEVMVAAEQERKVAHTADVVRAEEQQSTIKNELENAR